MTIKTGDLMASTPGQTYTMISDGKRLRVLWEPNHGDGDPSAHFIDRCMNTVKGHPTWKLFCDDVPDPIVRNKNEPPHHVYLDDLACYAVLKSQQYTNQELRMFWPFDFDQIGNIRASRANRGRPAFADDMCREYATGPVRGRKKIRVYIFRGAADTNDDTFHRSGAVKSKEDAVRMESLSMKPALLKASPKATPVPEAPLPKAPLKLKATHNSEALHRSTARTPFKPNAPASVRYIPGSSEGSLKPIGMARNAIDGSPYSEEPTSLHRRKPRPSDGNLAVTLDVTGVLSAKRKRVEVGEEQMKKPKMDD